ncbi:MAG: serine protease [bacterium]
MHIRNSVLGLMGIVVVLLIQGCTTFGDETPSRGAKAGILKGAIDDQWMKDQLLAEAKMRLNAKTLTPGETLRGQLSRKTTKVTFTTPNSHVLSESEQYEYARPSVVIIGSVYLCGKCKNLHLSTAAGFAVSEEGVFLTNHHVVSSDTNALGMVAITADGKVAGVTEVLAANQVEDWALIRIPELKLNPLPLKGNVSVGSEVFLVSHPNEHFFSFGKGNVARYGKGKTHSVQGTAKERHILGVTEWLEITAEFGRGASGGPVMDACGNVVGLISRVEGSKVADSNEDHNLGRMIFKQCTPIGLVINGASPTH